MADPLPILYQKIADMTGSSCANGKDECEKFAGNKYRCCERQYCEMARTFAKEKYGIDLQDTGNPDLPFMGENGCTVAPHLRPICALHVCTWSWAAQSHIQHDEQKKTEYMELRRQIEETERNGN
jgi:hypothetical protein